jgi:hypothetical protein
MIEVSDISERITDLNSMPGASVSVSVPGQETGLQAIDSHARAEQKRAQKDERAHFRRCAQAASQSTVE